ncbi:hypothetical protein L198_01516 [Cryptococcus wingfieldii CBS 7118]|uniref:Uncharacterized protein n=1 Tax=Cryptococcus wingfieldii CBS 7118 TaxID=1295528 RepID=A0A1E3JZI4_9TREE|nr:hypothetical protein L198_01516 [Cryptococcus wingfieldii CBS 7118]ODO06284.1 hypothetical protein L198_01516 [Cryptococcus wingfieldii CBS 7118]
MAHISTPADSPSNAVAHDDAAPSPTPPSSPPLSPLEPAETAHGERLRRSLLVHSIVDTILRLQDRVKRLDTPSSDTSIFTSAEFRHRAEEMTRLGKDDHSEPELSSDLDIIYSISHLLHLANDLDGIEESIQQQQHATSSSSLRQKVMTGANSRMHLKMAKEAREGMRHAFDEYDSRVLAEQRDERDSHVATQVAELYRVIVTDQGLQYSSDDIRLPKPWSLNKSTFAPPEEERRKMSPDELLLQADKLDDEAKTTLTKERVLKEKIERRRSFLNKQFMEADALAKLMREEAEKKKVVKTGWLMW